MKVNLEAKFALFSEHWRPKVVAAMNGQEVKLAKFEGVFPWHRHEDCDEMFLGWKGAFRIEFRGHTVEIGPGDLFVVPRGEEHRTAADHEAWAVIFEPAGVRNTGDVEDETYTAPQGATV